MSDAIAWTYATASGWVKLGAIIDDGLAWPDNIPVTMFITNGDGLALVLTCPSKPIGWRAWRELLWETHPSASRVKREYHRRRR
ncbi:hypothetical protein [Nonomuraea sp. NPDC049646]|uniref:hypothetical protein n=1 Tax=unclassified Nonomuraea TaxID=2593643 RepID=UPI0037B91F11